ncbi:histidine kinase dimerization/phospho-acceptor domain-containing protein [Ornithinimicrobium sp. Y1847]|uniref:HAMP domain-containing sensor histidine kinase n=1 Tax=unclassified Ornithinimicrobium TaxID=2615080 RepID=UPI003B67FDF3
MGVHSLRVRIALAVAIISLIVSSLVGLALADRAERSAVQALREQTLGQLDAAAAGYRVDGRLRGGATTATRGPADLTAGLAEGDRRSFYDGTTMWAAERIGPSVVLTIEAPGQELREEAATRARWLVLTILGSAVASGLLGWVVATALSRRLRRAARSVHRVAAGEPGARAHEGGRDEVAALTRAIDEMADRLSARLEAEQAFTADVAHELRTPLTGLVSAAELLGDDEAAELVRAQVRRMRLLVEDLLEISQLERGTEDVVAQPLDLATIAPALLDRARTHLALDVGRAPEITLEVRSTGTVLVEERRLDRVLSNLFTNLARHGGQRGRLLVEGTSLILEDDGPGYPEELIGQGPRRFHGLGANKGSGLGLTIALRQLQAMGGRLVLGQAEAPWTGARTVIELSGAPARR